MANPTPYQPSYSFTGWQSYNPSRPLPAQRVDIEFQNLKLTTDEIITALAQIRRSDGKLFNGVVDLASLSDEVIQRLGGGGGAGGSVILATKAQAEAGTSNAVVMTPLRVKEAIAVFAGDGSGGTGPGGPIAISDVTGLQTALDGKSQVGHTHAISAVNGLQSALDGKSNVGHAHNIGDVTGLEQALTGKVSTATRGQPGGTATLANDGLLDPAQVRGGGGADAKAPAYFTKTDTLTDSKLFSRADQAADVHAQKLIEAVSPFNTNYAGGNISAFHVRHVAEGTERNGPRGAALGASISLFKEGFGTGTAKGGEMDGLYIVLRQDSPRTGVGGSPGGAWADDIPDRGDGCGILIDAAVYQDVGFVGGIEGVTHMLSKTAVNGNGGAVPIKTIGYQLGCIDSARTNSIGLFLGATTGASTTGLLITNNEANGGYFETFIAANTHAGTVFSLNRRGELGIGARLDNGTTINPSVHIRLQNNYSLGFLNAAKDVQLMNLNQNGDLGLFGVVSATNLIASGTISANSTISTSGSVQASGNIIAGGRMQAAYIDLVPGGDPANGASGQPGRLWVGPSGALRYYDSAGQARRVALTD